MAEVKLTQAQQAVVENRGGALLVSAAAGSGKTKVLVDRLLSYVEDPIDPANIDDFLIITYTKAAASELRGKISAEISKRLAVRPDNRHLQRQLTRIHLAQISTVHAFCAMLLRRYCTLRDLPPDFRVAEQTEADAIRLEIFHARGLLQGPRQSGRLLRHGRPAWLWARRPAAHRPLPFLLR